MIPPQTREHTIDLANQPLGPGWLRVAPTHRDLPEEIDSDVWCTGPQLRFRDQLVEGLANATEVALVCSFLFAEPTLAKAMIAAADRGVRVYVLTASEQRIGRVVREDDAFEQRMVEDHKRLLETLANKVRLRSAEHIHAKFLVVDPKLRGRARAWLSTANFNKALSDSVELGVQLDGSGAAALAGYFQWAFWCEAERELRDHRRLVEVRPRHPAAPPRPEHDTVLATLRDGTALRERVLSLIREARGELLVASYGLAVDHPAVEALRDAAQRGVRVTILTRPRPAVHAAIELLDAAGATVLAHDKLHAKAVVADGRALVMTANLEAHGLDRGFEIGALLPTATGNVIAAVLRGWAASFPWRFRANATRGEHLGDFCPADAGLRDGVVVVTQAHAQTLPAVTARDALRLDDAPAPALDPAPPKGQLPRAVTFTWEVQAPAVPKQARERKQKRAREQTDKHGKVRTVYDEVAYDPPMFEHRGSRYIKLRTLKEADAAARLAAELDAVVAI